MSELYNRAQCERIGAKAAPATTRGNNEDPDMIAINVLLGRYGQAVREGREGALGMIPVVLAENFPTKAVAPILALLAAARTSEVGSNSKLFDFNYFAPLISAVEECAARTGVTQREAATVAAMLTWPEVRGDKRCADVVHSVIRSMGDPVALAFDKTG